MKVPVDNVQGQQPIEDLTNSPEEPIGGDVNMDIPDQNIDNNPVDKDNPFEDEKFDAGIDVNEDEDPKKYIEKLTGKLAQKLRDYNETDTDIELNKFVINSLIPASIPTMDKEDAKDVIKKVQDNIGESGQESGQDDNQETPEIDGLEQEQSIESGQESGQEHEEVKESIDDLVNEILNGIKTKPINTINKKNPFKTPVFK